MRSIAKDLQISPGYLSKIFSGRAPLPKRLIHPLVKALKIDRPRQAQLIQAISRETLRQVVNPQDLAKAKSSKTDSSVLDVYELGPVESEWLLGKWYRTALLDMTCLKNFRNDPEWIAKRLGISAFYVKQSLDYLLNVGLLAKLEDGSLVKKHPHLRFPSTLSKKVYREHHVSQLNRAIQIIEDRTTPRDFTERQISSITIACNPDQLEKIKLKLHQVIYEAAQELSRGSCQEIYQLNLQLFPQTKNNK